MEQTVLTKLIESVKEIESRGLDLTMYGFLTMLENSKEDEEKQIAEAWNDGNFLGRNGHILMEYDKGKEYYKKTYGAER